MNKKLRKQLQDKEHDRLNKPFPITSVCRVDLESKGFDTSKVDDADMEYLASKMADAYCDNGFWEDLQIIAEENLKIPKK